MGISAEVAERVLRGEAWLDEHRPGWVGEVDLDKLNLDNTCLCVLGQLYADPARPDWGLDDYESGYEYALGTYGGDTGLTSWTWALSHGFLADTDGEYPDLTAAWRELILDRRAAGS